MYGVDYRNVASVLDFFPISFLCVSVGQNTVGFYVHYVILTSLRTIKFFVRKKNVEIINMNRSAIFR